jgi:glycosyltransferase involved in cell wall biosynthesis
MLSVVVPVYDVEEYLSGCLDSILAQPVDDYEVVLVDDGSTDSSGEVAAHYVASYSHLRLVRQPNAGLGAARNAGVAAARGRLLTFVDSDDELPPDAWSHMLATLERSGSDFVVGTLERDNGTRRYATARMRENHVREVVGTDVHRFPRMLADVFAVNKIYRRDFWDAAGLAFPVGVRYEDQPTLTRAFLAARAFDVVRETVYRWRVREDRSSITQRRHDIADLRDRVRTKRDSHQQVVARAPDALGVWLADILPVDMAEYFRSVPGCSEEYWSLLRDCVREFWHEDSVPFERTLLPVQQRVMGWLVAQDRRADVERVVAAIEEHGPERLPLDVRGDRVVCLLPGHDDPGPRGLPERLVELGDHELRWEARAVSVEWAPDGPVLHGFALIRNAPTLGVPTSLDARLEPDGAAPSAREGALSLEARDEPRATRFVGRDAGEFDACGFTLRVDAARLAGRVDGRVDGRLVERPHGAGAWRFRLERTVAGVRRGGGIVSWNPPVVGAEWHRVGARHEARLEDHDDALVLVVRVRAAGTPG